MTTNLFQLGDFVLSAQQPSGFKIECDALTADDWETLAALGAARVDAFGRVEGIPEGGIPFAEALSEYENVSIPNNILLVDDVASTGRSILRRRDTLRNRGLHVQCLVAFSRISTSLVMNNQELRQIIPIFQLTEMPHRNRMQIS